MKSKTLFDSVYCASRLLVYEMNECLKNRKKVKVQWSKQYLHTVAFVV